MKKMKTLIGLMLISIILFLPMQLQAATVEEDRLSSLKIKYSNNGDEYDEVEVNIYRVAEVQSDGSYVLTDVFADCPVHMNGITSQVEWNEVRDTLNACIVADKIEPTYTAITDKKGVVSFEDILPGMYLVCEVCIEKDKEIVNFESFLVAVPNLDKDGVYNYDVVSIPKGSLDKVEPGVKEYKVVKLWEDYGMENERPDQIEIEIYKNGVLNTTVQLSEENNWMYCWEAENDGSIWKAIEKNVPDGYHMKVMVTGNTIQITNICENDPSDPKEPFSPEIGNQSALETGDKTSIWPYILGLCFSGLICILIGIWRKRNI